MPRIPHVHQNDKEQLKLKPITLHRAPNQLRTLFFPLFVCCSPPLIHHIIFHSDDPCTWIAFFLAWFIDQLDLAMDQIHAWFHISKWYTWIFPDSYTIHMLFVIHLRSSKTFTFTESAKAKRDCVHLQGSQEIGTAPCHLFHDNNVAHRFHLSDHFRWSWSHPVVSATFENTFVTFLLCRWWNGLPLSTNIN